jgi:hypothetical protein
MGEDLILLTLEPGKGVIRGSVVLPYGLNAAGLADLVALGHVVVTRPDGSLGITPTGDGTGSVDEPPLDQLLTTIRAAAPAELHPVRCIREWHEPSMHAYLDRLRKRGIVDWDKPKQPKARYGRFRLLDVAAAAAVRDRLDQVVKDTATDERDLALASIVYGTGLYAVVYGGLRGHSKRRGLEAAVSNQRFAVLVRRALPPRGPDQKFTFDSSGDLKMARDMIRAVEFDARQSGYDSGGNYGS